MDNLQVFNRFSPTVINTLIEYYRAGGSYDTATMNKLSIGEMEKLITPVIETITNEELSYANGNFYEHSYPYLPHTDYQPQHDNTLNVVIPLQYTSALPNLVVFDQRWEQSSVTWCMHHPVMYFSVNIGIKGCPHEYPSVKNLTGKDIPDDLARHLVHYPKHCLFGLSGTAYPFTIGSAILFDNRKIHCTSYFTGVKLGVSLRYKVHR